MLTYWALRTSGSRKTHAVDPTTAKVFTKRAIPQSALRGSVWIDGSMSIIQCPW